MPNCPGCNKPVYFAERVSSIGKDWHRPCLRCENENCRKTLTAGNHSERQGKPYCNHCYGALFGPKGYGHGGSESHTFHNVFRVDKFRYFSLLVSSVIRVSGTEVHGYTPTNLSGCLGIPYQTTLSIYFHGPNNPKIAKNFLEASCLAEHVVSYKGDVLITFSDSSTHTLFCSTVILIALMSENYEPTDTEESVETEIEEPLPPRSYLETIETNTTAVHQTQDVRRMQEENDDSDSDKAQMTQTRTDIISKFFDQFGENIIDWPHRQCCNVRAPPNGYMFIIFSRENAVHRLLNATEVKQGKRLIVLKNGEEEIKTVQVKPWILSCLTYSLITRTPFVGRYSIFVRGIPRTMTAMELAQLFQQVVGNVVEVSLGVEYGLDYPRGSARIIFGTHEAFHIAIAMRRFKLCTFREQRILEMRPYVLDDMWCDICHKAFALYLCPELPCLLYYCVRCWFLTHQEQGMNVHKPVSRAILGLWKNWRKNQNRRRNRYIMRRGGYYYFHHSKSPSEPDREHFSAGYFPMPPRNAS
ncbi:Cysteine-rich protein 1 [Dirofilaria immitis]|nr:Cysteine-rich protein 1 [Dirofilaria immitis]